MGPAVNVGPIGFRRPLARRNSFTSSGRSVCDLRHRNQQQAGSPTSHRRSQPHPTLWSAP